MPIQLDGSIKVTRRSIMQAIGLAFVCKLRSISSRFTSIEGADLAWLMRWGCFYSGPQFAGAG